MNQRRRVVITGLGVVAPNGVGKDAFWQSLIAGKSAVDRVSSFDATKYASQVAGEIRNFDATDYMPTRIAKSVGRFTHLAVAASVLAVHDSKLPFGLESIDRPALCFGTSASGSADIGDANVRRFLLQDPSRLDPLAMLELSAHAATSHVAQMLRITGPTTTLASGCTTGLDVIEWGCGQIAAERTDLAIVGATEAPLSEFLFALFSTGGFLSTWQGDPAEASRPYDLLRSGLVLSEGAGALVLESIEHALHRSAPIYGEILGYGSASEGGFDGHRREIYKSGLEHALRSACRDAGIVPSQIDYVSAHGNSTKDDDAGETLAYKSVFGRSAFNIPISSIKSAIGQPLAAAGVLQVAATALSIRDHFIPPTLHLDYPDPECDLDYVPKKARRARVRTALIHAHSLGGRVPGTHTALLIGRAVDAT